MNSSSIKWSAVEVPSTCAEMCARYMPYQIPKQNDRGTFIECPLKSCSIGDSQVSKIVLHIYIKTKDYSCLQERVRYTGVWFAH